MAAAAEEAEQLGRRHALQDTAQVILKAHAIHDEQCIHPPVHDPMLIEGAHFPERSHRWLHGEHADLQLETSLNKMAA